MPGYVVKITIENTHPPVWRRIVLPEGMTFYQLHRVIQIAFDWEDEHLHGFFFPNADMAVALPEVGNGVDTYSEKEVAVDEILKLTSWIRYTYDFGYDWRHKIVLEKELPEYNERYATILKAKGDSFMEDSGGWIFGQRIPFSLEKANAQLRQYSFDRQEQNSETADLLQELHFQQQWQEFERSERKDMLKAIRRALGHSESKKSQIGEKVEKLEHFFEEKQAWEERNETSRWLDAPGQGKNKAAYEQMTLPGIEMTDLPEDAKKPGYVGYVFEKGHSTRSVEELLRGLSSKEAEDCAKYLQIPNRGNCGRDRLAEMIAEMYHAHPEYLLYILDEEEDYRTLLDLTRMEDGPIQRSLPLQSLACAVTLGLADIHITHLPGKKGGKAVVSLAADAQALLEALGKKWKRELHKNAKLEEHVKCCVLQYGLLEMDAFFNIYRNYWSDFKGKEEFFRFVYWHCGMNGLLQTVTHSETGASYVGIKELDLETVFQAQEKFAGGRSYRLPLKEDVIQLGKNIEKRYLEWEIFADILTDGMEPGQEELVHLISGLYFSVISGISATRLTEMVLPVVRPVALGDCVELWLYVMGVCMETDLAILKGYSRSDFSELTGISAGEIQLFEESKLKKTVDLKTHLWELPARLQLQIYELCRVEGEDSGKTAVAAMMKEAGCNNPELCWLFASQFFMEGEYDDAEEMLGRIRRRDQDESVEYLRQEILDGRELDDWDDEEEPDFSDMEFPFWEDGFPAPAQPYRRETPKIGRNDPCPCGSGKKYKKCCGK